MQTTKGMEYMGREKIFADNMEITVLLSQYQTY